MLQFIPTGPRSDDHPSFCVPDAPRVPNIGETLDTRWGFYRVINVVQGISIPYDKGMAEMDNYVNIMLTTEYPFSEQGT